MTQMETSSTGGLADVADETEIKALISANGLLNAVKYLIPSYTQCTVSYVSGGGVTADTAGGSGHILCGHGVAGKV